MSGEEYSKVLPCGAPAGILASDTRNLNREDTGMAIETPNTHRFLSVLSNIPWTFLVILFLVVTTESGIKMTETIWLGYVFLAFGMVVLFVEFFKSGDIRTHVFLIDLISSVVAVIIGAVLMTLMFTERRGDLTFFHWYGAAILVADAILSPFNAFRTAKRNIEVGQ